MDKALNINEIFQLMQDVPDYRSFLTVDELNKSMHQLAERFPNVVELIPLGHSRQGAPIHAMKIGSGRRTGLMFAMPHPNEPIGSMMLEFLSERLAEDEALREKLDYTWYIIKCIDVDGTRLNEGWFKGPYSLTSYARHFYRPPGHLQVEWSFPLDYKTLHFDQPLPETKALMKLMEEVKPDFVYSLHNAGFGGVYAYVSHDIPAFYPDFYRIVADQKLPLHLGEAEVPYAHSHSEAVFGTLGTEDIYDFLEANGVPDPAEVIQSGASSYAYATRFNPDVMYLVCEMPYFYNPAIHDTSPSDMLRREAVLAGLEVSKAQLGLFQEKYSAVQSLLTLQSPFRDAIESYLDTTPGHLAAQEKWAQTDPSLLAQATEAEKFDSLLVNRFYSLLSDGMFVRMIRSEIDGAGARPALVKALAGMEEHFNETAARLEKDLDYTVVPIQKLVKVQLGAGMRYAGLAK